MKILTNGGANNNMKLTVDIIWACYSYFMQEAKIVKKLNAAFIFIAPEANESIHRALVETKAVILHVVGVADYAAAVTAAEKLVKEQGVGAIELCAGFGNEGTAAVAKAVKGKALVGVVRFDLHPGLDHKSGDDLF